jgi:ankyrin repeat protein
MNRLVRAAEEGNERKVARLLDAYPELLEVEEEAKLVPLKVAAKHGRLGVVKLLIQRGADPNATGASWKTALYHATYRADGEMVAFLLDNGAAAHIADILDITPLMLACTNCCIEIVEKIAQHIGPGELEEKDDEGKTALHYAAESNDVEALVFLLSLGADAGSRDEGGRTPLFDTCLKGHLEAVQVLVEHTGPQVLKDVDDGENTLLHYAVSNFLVSNPYCENKIAALVRFLLLNGADATARNDGGKTALDVLQDEEPCSSLAVLKVGQVHTPRPFTMMISLQRHHDLKYRWICTRLS